MLLVTNILKDATTHQPPHLLLLVDGQQLDVRVAEGVQRDMSVIDGAKALLAGFGETPPPKDVAQARADVCSGRLSGTPCPGNHRGGWFISNKIAQAIQAQREKKLELKLEVQGEEQLGTCKACGCPLFLKVWYDSKTIYNHTPDADFDKMREYNPNCWLLHIQAQHHTL